MPPKAKTQAPQQVESDLPPWESPPVEGDPSIGEGQQIEPAGPPVEGELDDIMQSLMDWCVQYAEEHAADSADAMAAEVRRILAGEDAVAVLAESAPLNGKEHTEKPFLLHGFTLNPTDFSEGWPFYASMEASIPGSGDRFVVNCGGPKVIAALMMLWKMGEFPYPVKIRAKETRSNRTVLQLVAAGA